MRPPDSSKPAQPTDNALWRVPEWFPELEAGILDRLKVFHSELLKFNSKLNLIARSTEREADMEHFADCISAGKILLTQDMGSHVHDIGAGNGFPGLVMAILDSQRKYSLVESDSRKCEFIKHVAGALKLANVNVMCVRYESLLGTDVKVGISRGFASISKTVLASNRIFSKGGTFYHLKGQNWSTEIADLPSQLITLWKPRLVGEYALPVRQIPRAVVATQKVG